MSEDNTPRTYTPDDIRELVNDAADLIAEALRFGDECPEYDVMNLVINATMAIIEDPKVDFNTMVERKYDETTPEELKGWWSNWGQVGI